MKIQTWKSIWLQNKNGHTQPNTSASYRHLRKSLLSVFASFCFSSILLLSIATSWLLPWILVRCGLSRTQSFSWSAKPLPESDWDFNLDSTLWQHLWSVTCDVELDFSLFGALDLRFVVFSCNFGRISENATHVQSDEHSTSSRRLLISVTSCGSNISVKELDRFHSTGLLTDFENFSA